MFDSTRAIHSWFDLKEILIFGIIWIWELLQVGEKNMW